MKTPRFKVMKPKRLKISENGLLWVDLVNSKELSIKLQCDIFVNRAQWNMLIIFAIGSYR